MADTKKLSNFELIWGAKAIAEALNLSDRQTFYMLECGALPAKKIGGKWCADRHELVAFFRNPQPEKQKEDV